MYSKSVTQYAHTCTVYMYMSQYMYMYNISNMNKFFPPTTTISISFFSLYTHKAMIYHKLLPLTTPTSALISLRSLTVHLCLARSVVKLTIPFIDSKWLSITDLASYTTTINDQNKNIKKILNTKKLITKSVNPRCLHGISCTELKLFPACMPQQLCFWLYS